MKRFVNKITEDEATHVEPIELQDESIPDDVDLGGDNGQHRSVDPVKLVEAAPGSTLSQAREDLSNRLERKRKASNASLYATHHQINININIYG